ncbi:RNA-directed DNA polymerase from mobile element jockey [Eumeta japonica]|uniref:RNA-directed DNA polymerase from mobile element jockey n=1 Tax=Eumeta variegata TaxID=151549 RepID=A0A4C1WKX3_EUMVA|nr:RNA-directed DNA polymerase from mobile element jockey [Eumeta japonica]
MLRAIVPLYCSALSLARSSQAERDNKEWGLSLAECLADSIEHQCSDNPPYDLEHVRRVEEEVRRRVSLPLQDDLIPITHDEGKPRNLSANYRPISLLSVLGKLFEKTLKTRLSDQLIGKGLIINEQFGFRPHHSCPQQALRLVEYISEGFKVKRKTVAVFFDVAKAFDRVWHSGLIHKLYKLELPDRLVLIIHHYISNRHFSFRLDNTYSSMRPIRAGVPQGSTLSPTAVLGVRNMLLRLQRAIDELTQWLRLWRIDVNPKKRAADAPWYVKNFVLHRDLELPTISKYMKDTSERFFDVVSSHPNPLLVSYVSYEPPPSHHFCRRPRSVLLDPPDDLSVKLEKLIEVNKMAIALVIVKKILCACPNFRHVFRVINPVRLPRLPESLLELQSAL